jgi:glutathione synthase/RimK-type ligase-like ATP-grasp enzyme
MAPTEHATATSQKSFKVLVVSAPRGIWYTKQRLLERENIRVTAAKLTDISVELINNEISIRCLGKKVEKYDYVWIQATGMSKDVAYLLSLYLDFHKVPHTSPETEITKLVDLLILAMHKVAIPKTVHVSSRILTTSLDLLVDTLGYPFLLKSTVGYGGHDVHLVTTPKEFFELIATLPTHKKYFCQEFIPNSFDYRILVGNGRVLSGEMRIRNEGYRNNVSQGGQEVFLEQKDIPIEVADIAIAAANACSLQWAGVDVVKNDDTGKFLIFEVNRRPGLTRKSPEIKAAMTFLKDLKERVVPQGALPI